ncbi:MAG: hypothetical protein SGPRY_010646 [Prymnesium sp.]
MGGVVGGLDTPVVRAGGGPPTLGARREATLMRRADAVERDRGAAFDRREMMRDPAGLGCEDSGQAVVVDGEVDMCGVLAGAMPPPAMKRPSIQMLSRGLGLSGPLGEAECRDRWSVTPGEAEVAAVASLRRAADHRVDTAAAGGAVGPSHLATALGWLRRFVEVFPSRQLCMPHAGAGDE